MTLRTRLALFSAAIVALAVSLVAAALAVVVHGDTQGQVDDLLHSVVSNRSAALRGVSAEQIASHPDPYPINLAIEPGPFVEVISVQGKTLFASARLDGAPPTIPATTLGRLALDTDLLTTIDMSSQSLRVDGRQIALAGGQPAYLIAGESLAGADRAESKGFVLAGVAGGVGLAAALVATWFGVKLGLAPLRKIATTVEQIGTSGDLSRRLPARAGTDELGVLTSRFNAMLERLSALQTTLDDSLRRQKQFVADASHELRNPLTSIRTNLDFLVRHFPPTDREASLALHDSAGEAERMGRLVGDLLELARQDAGVEMAMTSVALNGVVMSVAEQLARNAPDRHINAVSSPPELLVKGNADAIHRLLAILVDNAIKHTQADGRIEVLLTRDATNAVLVVRDNGPGLPEGSEERIFERFHQEDPARSGGAGLGLAIARAIVAAHGGTLSATNGEPRGAVFTAVLPLQLEDPPAPSTKSS